MKRFTRKSLVTLSLGLSLAAAAVPAYASTYEVKPDDTLWKIAANRNLDPAGVRAANPGVDPLNLQAGDSIQLPDGKITVQGNDTFWTISRKLNIDLKSFMAVNPSRDPYNLYPGIVLQLPPAGTRTLAASVSPASAKPSVQANTVKAANGNSLSYSSKLNVVATAYSNAPEENGNYGPVDYFGNALKVGTIAVDPKVIPLGSKVYITGYNAPDLPAGGMVAQATDIGGAIKGNRVDIFLPGTPQKVSQFGMQEVSIYVLK